MSEYEIGLDYVDKASPSNPEDQFLRWIKGKLPTGIGMMGGIRVLKCIPKLGKEKLATIILVSNIKRKPSGLDNPWQDTVDLVNGRIQYWGDAKAHPTKRLNDFKGNNLLISIFQAQQINREDSVPILFFQKLAKGWVRFCGLCVLDEAKIEKFLHDDVPIPNYRFQLRILDLDKLNLDWIQERARFATDKKAPDVWLKWIKTGKIIDYKVWRKDIRSREEQLPKSNADKKILSNLKKSFNPREFEIAIEDILKHNKELTNVEVTGPIKDRGFDFKGTADLFAFDHHVDFLGEVKKWEGPVGPAEISRLAARLGRGQFGVFITTSYFTKQTQEELYEDGYPIKLISGSDLVNLLKRRGTFDKSGELNKEWIDQIKETCKKQL